MPKVSCLDKPWLRSYEEGVPVGIAYEPICLPQILDRTAGACPDKKALIYQGYEVTFRQLQDMVNRFAACLTACGIKKGDAVAILLPNLIPCVAAYYAVLKIGGIAVLNNPLYTDHELERQFKDAGVKLLVTLDLLANRMIDLRPRTSIGEIIIASLGDYLPFPKNVLFPLLAKRKRLAAAVKAAPGVQRWRRCLEAQEPLPVHADITPDDIAMYQYTGGTTEGAKGVELTHRNLSSQVQQCAAWFPALRKGTETMLAALPYFHVFGLTFAMNFSVYMGWTQLLVPKPQPEPLLEAIRKYRPTFVPLVPTMYVGMLHHPSLKKTDMSCIRGAFSGGSPLPVEVLQAFEKVTGATIVEGFGMTETSPITHANPSNGARKVGSIGLPVSDTLARIVDLESGNNDLPCGAAGELIVKGPQVMKGYKGRPEATAYTLRNGWCYTGDIAKMDADGYFYIVDRKKDIIITGGYNVYPREIDEVLYQHPMVQEACAIGIPDPKRGENIKAFVVLKAGATVAKEELLAFCKKELAIYKLPSEIEFLPELPKTSVGKILRRQLRAEEMAKRELGAGTAGVYRG